MTIGKFLKAAGLALLVGLPTYAVSADTSAPGAKSPDAKPKVESRVTCPGTKNMGVMHQNMGSMMNDMDSMMGSVTDPALKERMQKMHDQMTAMQSQMGEMMAGSQMKGRGMMGGSAGGGMMRGNMMQSGKKSAVPPAPEPK